MSIEKNPFIAVVGGDISPLKIAGLDSLLKFCDKIFLAGKLAVVFYMASKKLLSFGGVTAT